MMQWKGVFPAVTTQFKPDQSIDFAATAAHIERLLRGGVHGFIMLGTVGENCSLDPEEKRQVLKLAVDTVKGACPSWPARPNARRRRPANTRSMPRRSASTA
jgi:dihydrodipicolinate synthase/N-acetylneuraminate lyase